MNNAVTILLGALLFAQNPWDPTGGPIRTLVDGVIVELKP
jgi:hypothetical protein